MSLPLTSVAGLRERILYLTAEIQKRDNLLASAHDKSKETALVTLELTHQMLNLNRALGYLMHGESARDFQVLPHDLLVYENLLADPARTLQWLVDSQRHVITQLELSLLAPHQLPPTPRVPTLGIGSLTFDAFAEEVETQRALQEESSSDALLLPPPS